MTYDDISYRVELAAGGKTSFVCTIPSNCTPGSSWFLNDLVHSSTILNIGGVPSTLPDIENTSFTISANLALDKAHGKISLTILRDVMHMKRRNDGSYASTGPEERDKNADPWTFTITLP